jgi:hypothetical protein
MEPARKDQLFKLRPIAKASLTRIQTFIETGDLKFNDTQLRFDDLPIIFNKFGSAKSELELLDNTDHSSDRKLFETLYYQVKAKFNIILHPAIKNHGINITQRAVSQNLGILHQDHIVAVYTLSYLSFRCPPMMGKHVIGFNIKNRMRH